MTLWPVRPRSSTSSALGNHFSVPECPTRPEHAAAGAPMAFSWRGTGRTRSAASTAASSTTTPPRLKPANGGERSRRSEQRSSRRSKRESSIVTRGDACCAVAPNASRSATFSVSKRHIRWERSDRSCMTTPTSRQCARPAISGLAVTAFRHGRTRSSCIGWCRPKSPGVRAGRSGLSRRASRDQQSHRQNSHAELTGRSVPSTDPAPESRPAQFGCQDGGRAAIVPGWVGRCLNR